MASTSKDEMKSGKKWLEKDWLLTNGCQMTRRLSQQQEIRYPAIWGVVEAGAEAPQPSSTTDNSSPIMRHGSDDCGEWGGDEMQACVMLKSLPIYSKFVYRQQLIIPTSFIGVWSTGSWNAMI
jgi:hypothetical protein